MRQLPVFVAVAVAGAVLGSAIPARAEKQIALESQVGERNADADKLLKPIFGVLIARGFEVGVQMVGSAFEARVSRPALTAAGLPGDFAAQVERGQRAWVTGKFEDAVDTLSPLIEAAHQSSGAFAVDQTLRDPLLQATIVLALSQQRTGDSAAMTETFAELLRAFPGSTVSRATYGSDAVAQFDAVKKALAATRHGKLTVHTTGDVGLVFIDEKIQKVGTVSLDVVPGTYRVFAQFGKQLSRVHLVTVAAGDDIGMDIDPAFDASVHTGPGWAGLAFATAAEREEHEAAYAADFASDMRATAVTVVGIDSARGKPVVFAALVNPRNGREIRRASVAMAPPPSEDRLKALASFIADNQASADIVVEKLDDGPATSAHGVSGPARARGAGRGPADGGDDGSDRGRWGGWKYMTGTVALGALGAGAYLLAKDGDCADTMFTPPCKNFYHTAGSGWAAVGGGAVFTAITIYLIATGGSHGPAKAEARTTAYVTPSRGGTVVGISTRF